MPLRVSSERKVNVFVQACVPFIMANPNAVARSAPHYDWLIASVCEGTIILLVCLFGWLLSSPLIFSSLGATAFEQIEKSRTRSSRPYNIVVGHLVGLGSGFVSVAVLGVWGDPAVLSSHQITLGRIWAAVLAVMLTVALNQILKATQPAACSTSLLVALGSFSNVHQALLIVGGVLAIAVIGEPFEEFASAQQSRIL